MSLEEEIADDVAYAQDPSTTPEELDQLSSHFAEAVLRAVAQNMASPKEALARLFEEFPEEVVSNPASALFNMEPAGAWTWIPIQYRYNMAKNENASHIVLEALASDFQPEVRVQVAKNKSTPIYILEALASDASSKVLLEVGRNERTPLAILEAFASSDDLLARAGVAQNSSTPVALLRSLALDVHWTVRCRVAENANSPMDLLKSLSLDANQNVRDAAK